MNVYRNTRLHRNSVLGGRWLPSQGTLQVAICITIDGDFPSADRARRMVSEPGYQTDGMELVVTSKRTDEVCLLEDIEADGTLWRFVLVAWNLIDLLLSQGTSGRRSSSGFWSGGGGASTISGSCPDAAPGAGRDAVLAAVVVGVVWVRLLHCPTVLLVENLADQTNNVRQSLYILTSLFLSRSANYFDCQRVDFVISVL